MTTTYHIYESLNGEEPTSHGYTYSVDAMSCIDALMKLYYEYRVNSEYAGGRFPDSYAHSESDLQWFAEDETDSSISGAALCIWSENGTNQAEAHIYVDNEDIAFNIPTWNKLTK